MRSLLLLLALLGTAHPAIAEIPPKFVGDWTVEVEEGPGFPWWDHVKYPVSISITNQGADFEDQAGSQCRPSTFFYDAELDALIFKHCLQTKSDLAIAPFYRAKLDGTRLLGETWTYKLLFRWAGQRKN